MAVVRLALALLPLALVACVGEAEDTPRAPGPPRTLDCPWIRGDNCFKSTVAAATSCLPPLEAVGALSDDGRTCTFATGQTVTFDDPVSLPLPEYTSVRWSFTVRANGRDCLRVGQPDGRHMTVASSLGAVEFAGTDRDDLTVTCPDGSRYVAAEWSELQLSCGAGAFVNEPPGASYSIEVEPVVSFWLIGTGGPGGPSTSSQSQGPGATHIFRCQR